MERTSFQDEKRYYYNSTSFRDFSEAISNDSSR